MATYGYNLPASLALQVQVQYYQQAILRAPRCQQCNQIFLDEDSFFQHFLSSPLHHFCQQCGRHFPHSSALIEHQASHQLVSASDYRCDWCNKSFPRSRSLKGHLKMHHKQCGTCGYFFRTGADVRQHELCDQWYCAPCDRVCMSEEILTRHLSTSAAHLPHPHRCPGRKCQKVFIDHGSIMQHLESGACPSGVTRQMIDKYVVQADSGRVITDGTRLIRSGGELVPPETVTVYATSKSFNGEAFECVVCHKTFNNLGRLNQHLASPAHAEKIYRCPTVFDGCAAEFGTLSALVQHVEKSSCGVRRFKQQMVDVVDDVTSRMRMLRC